MNVLRSVGARLSLALALVVRSRSGSCTPSSYRAWSATSSDAKLDAAHDVGERAGPRVPDPRAGAGNRPVRRDWRRQGRRRRTGARVVAARARSATRPRQSFADSARRLDRRRQDPVALDAARSPPAFASGFVDCGGQAARRGRVPRSGPYGSRRCCSSRPRSSDTLANVELVERPRARRRRASRCSSPSLLGYGARAPLRAAASAGSSAPPTASRAGTSTSRSMDAAGRARPARPGVRAHARPPGAARARAARVHRQRLARAAHADLLARRLPRAARDEDLDEATRREFLAPMQEQVARLTRLATDLLDLSRLDAGRLHVEREPSTWPRSRRRSRDEFAPLARSEGHGDRARASTRSPRRSATSCACCRSAGSWSRTRSGTRAPGTPMQIRRRPSRRRGGARRRGRRAGIAAEHAPARLRALLPRGGGRPGSGLGLAIARELADADGRRARAWTRGPADGLRAPPAGGDRGREAREPVAGRALMRAVFT